MTHTHPLPAALLAALLAGACSGHSNPSVTQGPLVSPPEAALMTTLLEGLGDHSFPVTSQHPAVQRWFDQGLMLAYGFNHDAAERARLRASERDPQCALGWWGAARVLGPNDNATMDPTVNHKARGRLQKATALAPAAGPRERAYIQAVASRYAAEPRE